MCCGSPSGFVSGGDPPALVARGLQRLDSSMNSADLAELDIAATDAYADLPGIVARINRLYHSLWHRPSGGDGVHVQASGHTDPTGQTVATSAQSREHIDRALRLTLDACAAVRGAQAALNRAEGTVDGYDGTQQAADMAQNRTRCTNCRDHAPTKAGEATGGWTTLCNSDAAAAQQAFCAAWPQPAGAPA